MTEFVKHKNENTNRLANEKSPYLLQHSNNPVDWFPWGVEAFSKAQSENKPIFLSVGYSTCHWCHVMSHESFEDDEVANILNSNFVSIKVDREERPDIDSIYMKVCQMLTGSGGWPLSVFLTPNQQPFYAGTYFPKNSRYGRPGFIDILKEINDIYIKQPDKVTYITDQISSGLNAKFNDINNESKLSSDILQKTFSHIETKFDKQYGGFGDSPKFPTPHLLMFLLKYNFLKEEDNALQMVTKTLDSMANGGIYDHIGFGFSRYSVDEKWLVPHFEKMLYDNALLLIAYTEAYQVTKNIRYLEMSKQIITFVENEMTNQSGGFYSAIDADSEGIEGKYYVWDIDEIYNILGIELGNIFCETYNISETGNFDDKNIPNLINTDFNKICSLYNLKIEQLTVKLETAKKRLLEERKKRVFPHTDDKILTSWNALLITSLAIASRITDKERCLELADKSLTFIENNLIIDERIMVRYRDNEVKNKGYVDDYAFLLWAYIEMYESTFDLNYLKKAKQINKDMISLFWDNENGGFYFYGSDAENLIVREKEIHDGAIPSGNGVAAYAIIKLANILGDISLVEITEQMFTTFKNEVESYPSGHTSILEGLILQNINKKEIVILGNKNDKDRQRLLQAINESFLPNLSVLVAENPEEFKDIADYAINYKLIDGKTTIYICENFSCKQPTTNINEVYKELKLNNNQYVIQ